jgi:hypothetical protein
MALRRTKRAPSQEDEEEKFFFTRHRDPPKENAWKGRWTNISPDASPALARGESTLSLSVLIPSIPQIVVVEREEVVNEEKS